MIDNEINNQTKNDCIEYKLEDNSGLSVESPTTTYFLQQIQFQLESLSQEQLSSVLTIIKSINELNSNNLETKIGKTKRCPGGINGEFLMSEDFDEPLYGK